MTGTKRGKKISKIKIVTQTLEKHTSLTENIFVKIITLFSGDFNP